MDFSTATSRLRVYQFRHDRSKRNNNAFCSNFQVFYSKIRIFLIIKKRPGSGRFCFGFKPVIQIRLGRRMTRLLGPQ